MARERDAFTKGDGQDPAAASPATTASPVVSATPTAQQEHTGTALDATTALPRTGTAQQTQLQPQAGPLAGPVAESADGAEKRGIAAWLTVPWLTVLLAVGIVAALGFIAGVLVERHQLP
ncbi:hypothetical protein [Streptomyces sp. NBC_00083]|uniref:hypothetical protein n=1 Tax=Streptomyces sp. NBC_00083 TaxID=2975647 RepID=UPI002253437D|nr:hypothetical protein [Streptomyces sp. NBC_00083]MCX5384131.1 hypothetical protein [Streptomyces sp. NBC_00083]